MWKIHLKITTCLNPHTYRVLESLTLKIYFRFLNILSDIENKKLHIYKWKLKPILFQTIKYKEATKLGIQWVSDMPFNKVTYDIIFTSSVPRSLISNQSRQNKKVCKFSDNSQGTMIFLHRHVPLSMPFSKSKWHKVHLLNKWSYQVFIFVSIIIIVFVL